MRKLAVSVILLTFVLGWCQSAMAEHKKVFAEYTKEEDRKEYESKLGFEYETDNHWFFYLTHQLEDKVNAEPKTFMEVKYLISKYLATALQYETYRTRDSMGFKFSSNYQFSPTVSSSHSISYTGFSPQAEKELEPDFTELKLYGEIKYRINESLLAIAGCESIKADYDQNVLNPKDNPDYHKMEYLVGLEYRFVKNGQVWSRYFWDEINKADPDRDDESLTKLVIGANYDFNKYTFYCSYPFPQKGNSSTFGVSYRF